MMKFVHESFWVKKLQVELMWSYRCFVPPYLLKTAIICRWSYVLLEEVNVRLIFNESNMIVTFYES